MDPLENWCLALKCLIMFTSNVVFPFFSLKIYGEKNTHYSFSFNFVCSYLAKNGHLPCIKFVKFIFVFFFLILFLYLFFFKLVTCHIFTCICNMKWVLTGEKEVIKTHNFCLSYSNINIIIFLLIGYPASSLKQQFRNREVRQCW